MALQSVRKMINVWKIVVWVLYWFDTIPSVGTVETVFASISVRSPIVGTWRHVNIIRCRAQCKRMLAISSYKESFEFTPTSCWTFGHCYRPEQTNEARLTICNGHWRRRVVYQCNLLGYRTASEERQHATNVHNINLDARELEIDGPPWHGHWL